jgi:hypothetical protein
MLVTGGWRRHHEVEQSGDDGLIADTLRRLQIRPSFWRRTPASLTLKSTKGCPSSTVQR